MKRGMLWILGGLAIFLIIYIGGRTPKNDRVWESGFERLNTVTIIDETHVSIADIRDWRYSKEAPTSFKYFDETYDLEKLEQVWFVLEPFSKWQAVAHTYFIFDFSDKDESLSISIEARREKNETYDGLKGMFRTYELYYSWGTETDFTGRRAYKDDAVMYMYPMKLSHEQSVNLLKHLALETNKLAENPRFYHTFSSNCTNELAKVVRSYKPDALPWYSVYVLPGYADRFLYDQGYLDVDVAKYQLHEQYLITDVVQKSYPDFKGPVRERISGS